MKKKITAILASIIIIACLVIGVVLHTNNQIKTVDLTEQDGLAAYELALSFGYDDTFMNWLENISAKSSYKTANDNGFSGSETEWYDLIKQQSEQETAGIKAAEISSQGNLIITLTDNTQITLGKTLGTADDIIVTKIFVSDSNELFVTTSDSKEYNLGVIRSDKAASDNNEDTVISASVSEDGYLDITFSDGSTINSATSSVNNPTLCVDSITANAGETVKLNVSIINNPGINGALLDISYDSNLELINAQNGKALSSLNFTASADYSNPSKFLWDGINENEEGNGVMLILSFSVPSNAKSGEEYSVSVSYPTGGIYDAELNDVYFDTVNGSIKIQ